MKAVINWVISLIIGVIVILVLAPILFKVAGNVWTQLGLKLGWVKLTPVESAILCSYYRCTIGCASAEVTGVFGGRGWCADFPNACNLPSEAYEGEEKKVCGHNAEQWPVEIELQSGKDNTISKDKLQALMGINCLIKLGSGINGWNYFWDAVWRGFTGKAATNTIWISESLISSYRGKEECLGFTDCYKELKLKEGGKIYIVTYLDYRPLGVVHKITNLYPSLVSQIQLKVGESTSEFTQYIREKKLYRIVELDYSGKKTGEEYVVLEARPDPILHLKVKFSCEAEEKTVNPIDLQNKLEPTTETFCQGRYSVTWYEDLLTIEHIKITRNK